MERSGELTIGFVMANLPYTGVGMDAIESLRFVASLPLAGTGRTEGGEKTQPFNRFQSLLFIQHFWSLKLSHGLEETPVVHQLDPDHLVQICD